MDTFQSVESGKGMLKNFYDSDSKNKHMDEALKNRRKKMYENKTGEDADKGEENG